MTSYKLGALAWCCAAVAACWSAGAAAQNCPVYCACESDRVTRCEGLGLKTPPEGNWTSVRTLSLDHNNITELHAYSFTGYWSTTELSVRNNRLKELNVQAFRLYQLSSLDLASNLIETIVDSPLGSYSNLEKLNLSGNRIAQLDANTFTRSFSYLYTLDLSYNPLKARPDAALVDFGYVDDLNLDGIDASEISATTLVRGQYLKTLSLRDAGVTNITSLFTQLSRLSNVALAGNPITEVSAGSFYKSQKLTAIDLRRTPLSKLELQMVSEMMIGGSSSQLLLDDTPLVCQCLHERLVWWALGRVVRLSADCEGVDRCGFGLEGEDSSEDREDGGDGWDGGD